MDPEELRLHHLEIEGEENGDTALRGFLTPLLGFVSPIFKPDPNARAVFQGFHQSLQYAQIFRIDRKGRQIRVILSDGYDLEHAVLTRQLYKEFQRNSISRSAIVEITRYSLHSHIEKKYRLVRIHAWEVVNGNMPIIGIDSLEYGTWPFGGAWLESDWEEAHYRRLDLRNWYHMEEDIEVNLDIFGTRHRLTTDALVAINAVSSACLRPTLQIVSIRNVSVMGYPQEKFRMILSDGEHVQQSFLGTDALIQKAKAKLFVRGSTVKLLHFEWRTYYVSRRRTLFVLDMNLVTVESAPDPTLAISVPDFTRENLARVH